jgi:large subunit ribosomal protein L17
MRHLKTRRRIQRHTSHRKQLLENVVSALFKNQQIETTYPKAKAAQPLADQLITLGKRNTLHAKRQAFSILGSHGLTQKLFGEIAPRFEKRNGGYTRVLHYRRRNGDKAPMAILELTEKVIVAKKAVAKKIKEKKPETEVETSKTETKVSKETPDRQPKKSFIHQIRRFFRRKGGMGN